MIRKIFSFLTAGFLTLILAAADTGVSVNGIDAAALSGDGWSYAASKLILSGEGPYVLSGSNATGGVQIVVAADSTVVLSNLNVMANKSKCAFQIDAGKNVNLLLAGVNELESGNGFAGVHVPSGSVVRISQRSESLPGSLKAKGTAGIGYASSRGLDPCGSIFIDGGLIRAEGYNSGNGTGNGIGGGYNKNGGGVLVVSGGTVFVNGKGTYDIGGGAGASGTAVTITGGSLNTARGIINNAPTNALGEAVYCVTMTGLVANAAVNFKSLDGYGCSGIYADEAGRAYLWLSNGEYEFQANGSGYAATVAGGATTARVFEARKSINVYVNGKDVGFEVSGEGWSFDAASRRLVFTGTDPYVISGTNKLDSLTVACEVPTVLKFEGFQSAGLRLEGDCEIVGGTVAPEEATGAVVITGGSVKCNDFAVPPSNGVERVWRVTVGGFAPHSCVSIADLEDYGVDALVADASGNLYLWLPNGDYIFTANGGERRAIVDDAGITAIVLADVVHIGVEVNGVDVAYGYGLGWRYESSRLLLTRAREFEISGSCEGGVVKLCVQADAQVTVSNLVLKSASDSPVEIATGCAAEFVLCGENVFESTRLLCPGLHLPAGAGIEIGAAECGGKLTVRGGRFTPAIGGYDMEDAGRIVIRSGVIVAEPGAHAGAAIGGGFDGAGADVVITGGSVKAGAIDCVPVNERGESLSCVTVPGLVPNAAVDFENLDGYGVSGIHADDAGCVYLWLPDGVQTFDAGGRSYAVTVRGGAVTARLAGGAVPSRFSISAIRVGDTAVELELATDLSAEDFEAWAQRVAFWVDLRDNPCGEVVKTLSPQRTGALLSAERPQNRTSCFFTVRASE